MSPYETLGVPVNATDAEIKAAYRKLVKQFHPDVTAVEDKEAIAKINDAYEILSDPVKRANYDSSSATSFEFEEDPVEVYKQEFKRKKQQEAKLQKERAIQREQQTFKFFRLASFPILLFAIFLLVDEVLPAKIFREVAEEGWQERRGGRRSRGVLVSYMSTEHFILAVPHDIHLNYDYFSKKKQVLTIAATPIQKIPRLVSLAHGDGFVEFEVRYTLYSDFPWHYLLLLSSVFTILRKKYSKVNYMLCFLPLLMLAIVLLRLINY